MARLARERGTAAQRLRHGDRPACHDESAVLGFDWHRLASPFRVSLLCGRGRGQLFPPRPRGAERLAYPAAEAVESFFSLGTIAGVGEAVADFPGSVGLGGDAVGDEPRDADGGERLAYEIPDSPFAWHANATAIFWLVAP